MIDSIVSVIKARVIKAVVAEALELIAIMDSDNKYGSVISDEVFELIVGAAARRLGVKVNARALKIAVARVKIAKLRLHYQGRIDTLLANLERWRAQDEAASREGN